MHAADTARADPMPETADSSAGDAVGECSNDGRYLTLDAIERQAIESRLRAYAGNKSGAARSLGIALKTLYNKLASYRAADEARTHVG